MNFNVLKGKRQKSLKCASTVLNWEMAITAAKSTGSENEEGYNFA